jgi:F-type H+-transporting ATPase subunit delta
MRENSLAIRYAKGLVAAITDEPEYLRISGELRSFLLLLNTDARFKAGMETFLIPLEAKRDILKTIDIQSKLDPKCFNFLVTLVEENRLIHLEAMLESLDELWLQRNDIEKVQVFSAMALTPDQRDRLAVNLSKSFGPGIVVENLIDPEVLAGLRIQRRSTVYDFSLAGNLDRFKRALTMER